MGLRTASVTTVVLAVAACSPSQPTPADIRRFEADIAMPAGAGPPGEYARYYAPPRVYTIDDLPFTTIAEPAPGWAEPRTSPVVAAVFVRPGVWSQAPPGIHVVDAGRLPFAVHGGCDAVNLLFDPASGRTLAAWCNIDDTAPPPTLPTAAETP